MQTLTINGTRHDVDVEGDTPLLFVLRDTLGLTGTKYGCGIGQCGACTVILDGQATRSCQIPAESVGNAKITTIEAIGQDAVGKRVVEAWVGVQVPQCGYCQSGQVIAATALLQQNPRPTDSDIGQAMTHLCRCGTYNAIAAAVRPPPARGATHHARSSASDFRWIPPSPRRRAPPPSHRSPERGSPRSSKSARTARSSS